MRILFVEDDQTIALGLSFSLKEEGYQVLHCATVKEAMQALDTMEFSLALLDLTLPDGSGFDICKRIKTTKDFPVIVLSASDDEVSVVMGLDIGADDYITKPFRLRELLSRIKSVMRRYDHTSDKTLIYKDLELDSNRAKVRLGGKEIFLSALEYRILLILMLNKGTVLSREQLLDGIWDVDGQFINDNTLTVYIKRLREKLGEDMQHPEYITTVRGLGYRIGE